MKVESYSWSRINRFNICGQQWLYVYGEKLRRPPGVALFRGTGVHAGAELALKAKMAGEKPEREASIQAARDHIVKRFEGEYVVDGDYAGMSKAQARADVEAEVLATTGRYFDAVLPGVKPTAVEVKVEMPASASLPAPFIGFIDTIDSDVDIHDLKTKRKAPPKDFAETSGQLTTYAMLFAALKGRFPAKVVGDFVWRTPGGDVKSTSLESKRTPADVEVLIRRIQAQSLAIEREIFLPADADHWACSKKFCGYTDICPYFAGRERPTS